MYKVIKHFRPYLLEVRTIIYVPHPVVGHVQQELGERRANWMTFLQEYDLEFKSAHTIKGHCLYQLATEVVDSLDVITNK